MAQEETVNGAGQRGKWSRSVLVVGTCTAKRPRMAIPGAGQWGEWCRWVRWMAQVGAVDGAGPI